MNKISEVDGHSPENITGYLNIFYLFENNQDQIKRKTQVELNERKELFSEVRSILNKLTPENLRKATVDLINLSINNEDRLKGSVEIIFEKSIEEQANTQAYANLCKVKYYYHYFHSKIRRDPVGELKKISIPLVRSGTDWHMPYRGPAPVILTFPQINGVGKGHSVSASVDLCGVERS